MALVTFVAASVLEAAQLNDSFSAVDIAQILKSARVDTSQTSTSTSYADLATVGPAVTVTSGTSALVIVGARMSVAGTSSTGYMSFAISGATTVAASDTFSMNESSGSGTFLDGVGQSYASVITGLNAGSNVFTAKYRVTGNTGTWLNRQIIVVPL
jgi:hypothetical protein